MTEVKELTMPEIIVRYERQCEILQGLVNTVLKLETYLIKNGNMDWALALVKYGMGLTLTYELKWKDLKRILDNIINTKKEDTFCCCCLENFKKIKVGVVCSCSVEMCVGCYIDMFRMGMGKIKCPSCREFIGMELCCMVCVEKEILKIKLAYEI